MGDKDWIIKSNRQAVIGDSLDLLEATAEKRMLFKLMDNTSHHPINTLISQKSPLSRRLISQQSSREMYRTAFISAPIVLSPHLSIEDAFLISPFTHFISMCVKARARFLLKAQQWCNALQPLLCCTTASVHICVHTHTDTHRLTSPRLS